MLTNIALETMLGHYKVCAKWVAWILMKEQKDHPMQVSQNQFNHSKAEGEGFLATLSLWALLGPET